MSQARSTTGAATTGAATTATAPQPSRLAGTQIVPTLCVTALTVATAVSLCRVFPDWAYLRTMVMVVVGTHLVAALLRFLRVPLIVALPVVLFAIVEFLSLAYYKATMAGMLPSSRTLRLMRIDVRLVVEQFPSAVAPVPSVGNWVVAATAALALCAAMSDTFAFRAMGRMETIVPTGVVFVFTAALGTDRHRVEVAALWVGVALLVVAVLRFRFTSEETAWMGARKLGMVAALPTIAVMVGVTAIVAAAVAPLVPGAGDTALVDTRNREGSVTEVLSPIVSIGAQLRNRGNLELFTVKSSDGPHYWREIGLPVFDGETWEPGNETLRDMNDRTEEVLFAGTFVDQEITIRALGGHLVPSAYQPVTVDPPVVQWTADSQSLVLPDTELRKGDIINVRAKVLQLSPEVLRSTGNSLAASTYFELPGGVPATALELAQTITQDAATAYDKAIALQNWFRTNFTYDTDVQFGNSNDAMDAFLRVKRGFCQQFAGTFAVMARLLGLPTRVAVGFTGGDLGADGLYHVYGRHAHAWPEVWFDGLGWVAFEPTPGRGNGDAAGYTGVAEEQDQTGAVPGTDGTTDTTIPTTPGTDPAATTTTTIVDPSATTTTVAGAAGGDASGGSSSGGIPLALVLSALAGAALLWMLLAPVVVRRLAHRHDNTDAARVISAWQRTLGALSLAGAPAVRGATPMEYAAVAERATGADQRAVSELASHVTRAVYAPTAIDRLTVERCDVLAKEIDGICRSRIPSRTRLQMLFDVRLMRRRFAG